ncbi:hypothetical protein [Nostoc sp.]|uniref:hypothetical protein n=1 Tax=Nostoc sp. TaxID=1180 RepID=UPI003FA5DFEA
MVGVASKLTAFITSEVCIGWTKLTALHGLDRAQTLTIVLSSTLTIRRDRKWQRV